MVRIGNLVGRSTLVMTKHDHGQEEAARTGTHPRSPEWPHVEKAHLEKQPHCACCLPGTNVHAGVQVHHKFPFHYCIALGRPDLELDDRNLITLCEDEEDKPGQNHHLLIGHLDSFASSNLDVEHDAMHVFHGMAAEQIKADPEWQKRVVARLKPLDEMSAGERTEFRKRMDETFPRQS